MPLGHYRELLRRPHVAGVLATSLLARLPQGMSGLAILLFLVPVVGYGRSGGATGVAVATGALSSVWLARLIDRIGVRRVLLPVALVYGGGMIGLAESRGGPYPVVLVICAVIGAATPPITSVVRGLWPQILDPASAQTAYGLEATAQELIYIAGPAVVALIAGLADARTAVFTTGAVGLLGSAAFAGVTPLVGRSRAERSAVAVWRSGVVTYALVGLGLTAAFSMAEVATVAFIGGHGASARSGVVLALWSFGSMVGGLAFGRPATTVTDLRLALAITTMSAGIALAAAAPGSVGLAVILVIGGATIAPTLARLNSRIAAAAPAGATVEAFGWLAAAYLIGVSLGASAGGFAVDGAGPRWTFGLAALAAMTGVAVIGTRARPSR
ncbi:MAG TPA: hypothetical protein VG708_07050 [Mycobacteriales bacterium]|nr:hypothetical protein [Mycobacteriales bacterium]